MAGNDDRRTDGAPPREIHIERKRTNWFAWIALALGILALLLALGRCNRRDAAGTVATTPAATNSPAAGAVVAETPTAPRSAAIAGTSGLGAFLAGSQPTPYTFTFEKLNFDTARSAVRPQDAADLDAVADTLKKYPSARIRIAGYADTRGSADANVALGKARADSVKAALVARGIDAARIATASGGDRDPVDTNGTAAGRAENRRTELVVTQR